MRVLPLLAIVALGMQLRLTFYQGVIHFDDLVYSHLALRMAEGVSPFAEPLPLTYAAVRIGLYGPVALAYWLFGASDLTTLAWPFVCSMLGILGAYGIGRLVHDEAAGLLAAFVFAVLPTNVAAGTVLIGDGPIASLSIGTVFFLVLSSRTQGWKSIAAIAGSLVCFAVGLLNKPLILLLLPFVIAYVAFKVKRLTARLAGATVALLGVAGYILYFGGAETLARPGFAATMQRVASTATDLWQGLVVGHSEFAWIAPLWIVAVAVLLAWRRSEARLVLAWLSLTFLYGELGTRTLTVYSPIVWYDQSTPARHFLLVAAPAVILTGIYLAQGIQTLTARWLVTIVAGLTGVVAWFGSRGAANMNWEVTGQAAADLPFATLSGVASILVVFGSLASPVYLKAPRAVVRVTAIGTLLLAVALTSLSHSYRAAHEFKGPWVETFSEAIDFLESQPALPIVVQNKMFGLRLDYMSGYKLGFETDLRPFVQNARIEVAPPDPSTLTDAYILVDDYYLKIYRDLRPFISDPPAPEYLSKPPARWRQLAEFGKYDGSHLKLYRVTSRNATQELAAARAGVAAEVSVSSLRYLMETAAGAGAFCEAARAWVDLRVIAQKEELEAINAVPVFAECYNKNPAVAGPNEFRNPDFSDGLVSWTKHPDADATVEVQRGLDGEPQWYVNYRGGNWNVIEQEQVLVPNTAYAYEAEVKSTAPVVSLYWQSDVGRFLGLNTAYPDWTSVRYVFITPRWDGQAKRATFNPLLMQARGQAWLRRVRLSQLQVPPVQ
jgi:hypothetical protein